MISLLWLPASKPLNTARSTAYVYEHCPLFPCPEHSEDSMVPQIDHTKHTFRTAHIVSGLWGGNSQTGRWKPNHVYVVSCSHTLNSPVPSIHSGWVTEGREGGQEMESGLLTYKGKALQGSLLSYADLVTCSFLQMYNKSSCSPMTQPTQI